MAAAIPATNKWLLTKQASVVQSAEQWQAGGEAERRPGGRFGFLGRWAEWQEGHTDTQTDTGALEKKREVAEAYTHTHTHTHKEEEEEGEEDNWRQRRKVKWA